MPLKSGLATMALVFGSFHGLVPRARATKFRTVMGVSFSKSRAVIVPIEVLNIAYRPGSRAGAAPVAPVAPVAPAGALAGVLGGALGGGVWASPLDAIGRKAAIGVKAAIRTKSDDRFIKFSREFPILAENRLRRPLANETGFQRHPPLTHASGYFSSDSCRTGASLRSLGHFCFD